MKDYQEIIDAIRSAVAAPGEVSQEDLEELARQYAELCQQANRRVSECFRLIRQGQAAEAVRLADIEPRLIELVGVLDFPERQQWLTLCQFMQLTAPPKLLLDQAVTVNEAYDAAPSLESIMRRWRLQNLARAPLAMRTRTLRGIATLDPVTVAWREDVQRFEEQRHREIAREAKAARREENLDRLQALEEEVNSENWMMAVPRDVRGPVIEAIKEVRGKRARRRIAEVTDELHAAYSAGDAEEAAAKAEEFSALRHELGLPQEDPLCWRVEPALVWLDEQFQLREEQCRQEEAVAALDRAIDSERPLPELVKLHETATRQENSLPVELERRYRLTCARLEVADRRRYTTRLAFAVGGSMVLVVVLVFAVWQVLQHQQAAGIADTIRTHVAEGKLEAAREYATRIENQQPDLFGYSRVQAALSELQAAESEEARRQKEFAVLAKRLEKEAAEGDPARADLERLAAMARTKEEELKAEGLRWRAEARWQELDEQARRQWQEEYDTYAQRVRQLESTPVGDLLEPQLGELTRQIRGMGNRKRIPDSMTATIEPLLARVDRLQSRLRAFREEEARLRPLLTAIGRRARFQEALEEAAEANTERSEDYAKVAAALPWATVDDWNAFASYWNKRAANCSAADAERLLEYLETLGGLANELSSGRVQSEIRPYLRSVAKRDEEAMNELVSPWESSLVAESYAYWYQRDGRQHIIYSLEDKAEPLQNPTVRVGISTIRQPAIFPDSRAASFGNTRVETIVGEELLYVGPSPQRLLKEQLDDLLDRTRNEPGRLEANVSELLTKLSEAREESQASWERVVASADFLEVVRANDTPPPLNAMIFARLFVLTLDSACELSHPLKAVGAERFAPLWTKTEEASARWTEYEYVDDAGRAFRKEFASILPTPAQCQALAEDAADLLATIRRPLPTLTWIGFVLYDESGEPQLHKKSGLSIEETTLYCFRPSINPNSQPFLTELATINDQGTIQWETTSFLQGMPVFLLQVPPDD